MDPAEEDDDFGDFGGFEAADPALPNVAQVQPTGVEASPSPWAVFPAGSSPGNVRPDLLCGQNKFPPVLDPSVPSSSADIIQNGDMNNSHTESQGVFQEGASGNQNENYDDAVMANDILDGSFKSTSSPHSSSGPAAADLIRSAMTENQEPVSGRKDSQSVDLVDGLFDGTPGLVLIEDENLQNVPSEEPNPVIVQSKKSVPEQIPASSSGTINKQINIDTANTQPHVLPSLSGTSVSTESHHMNSPIMIDSLRKALQQKPATDVTKSSQKKTESDQKNTQSELDPFIYEEIRQARTESQNAISKIVEQYQELSKQCISQQDDVLRQCKQIFKKEQETEIQQLLQKQKDEFAVVIEEEKTKLQQQSRNLLQEMLSEQKKDFDLQMEEEKKKYEKRLQDALEEEKQNCSRKMQESLDAERLQMSKMLKEEKEKMKEDLLEERRKYLEEMKAALIEEKDKNKELVKELLEQEKNHCRECVKAAVAEVKGDMQLYIEQQKQKDRVVRQRQLSSIDVFLETAKQQINMLMESNDSELDNEKKDQT